MKLSTEKEGLLKNSKTNHPFFSRNEETESFFFQPKLTIGPTNDVYEREADSVANRIMRQEEEEGIKENIQTKISPSAVQRVCSECEEEVELQRKGLVGGSRTKIAPSGVNEALKSGSRPLEGDTRSFMESRLGYNFSSVRIHTGSLAAKSTREVNAKAYTQGSNIVFNEGQYAPGTANGKKLLAHELTHVVQQNGTEGLIQRSCSDGNCVSCPGGWKDFWVTFYFRRRATQKTMNYLRKEINTTKEIFKKCCLHFKADFNWTLLSGGGTFESYDEVSDPARWHYSADANALGTGNTFSGSRGVPVLVVDEVPGSGGGSTVDTRFDPKYTGRSYAVLPVNQPDENTSCSGLAHELWHVASGIVGHDPRYGTLAACTGNAVGEDFCNGARAMV